MATGQGSGRAEVGTWRGEVRSETNLGKRGGEGHGLGETMERQASGRYKKPELVWSFLPGTLRLMSRRGRGGRGQHAHATASRDDESDGDGGGGDGVGVWGHVGV
jgi:hypothetical protein